MASARRQARAPAGCGAPRAGAVARRAARRRCAALAAALAAAVLRCGEPSDPAERERHTVADFQQLWQAQRPVLANRFLGVPAPINPLDAWIVQELIVEVAPDFVVETHSGSGGSAALFATILEQVKPAGRVLGVDADASAAAQAASLPVVQRRVEFVRGLPTDRGVAARVFERVQRGRVLVILNAPGTPEELAAELAVWAPMVSWHSYLVALGTPEGAGEAIAAFLASHPDFAVDRSRERFRLTAAPGGFLQRTRPRSDPAPYPDAFTPEPGYTSLFNGRDLSGWASADGEPLDGEKKSSAGWFTAKNGILLVGGGRMPVPRYLRSTRALPVDFELKLEFRARRNSDSGIFVGDTQLEVRDYAVAGPYGALARYRAGDWNELEITVVDGVARSRCNGEVLEAALPVRKPGPLSIEADRGLIEYRRIRIRALP